MTALAWTSELGWTNPTACLAFPLQILVMPRNLEKALAWCIGSMDTILGGALNLFAYVAGINTWFDWQGHLDDITNPA